MLKFSQIEKHYRLGNQSVPALCGVSGEVQRGEMVALCGPSGSGKSTLLNLLGLLDMDYQGQIELDQVPWPKDRYAAAQIRRSQMGFVFQKFNLVPVMTALENVVYPLMLNGVAISDQQRLGHQILERVGLGGFESHRPDNLSGGQQQRVAIARAMIHQPQVVIADEPTASLDSQTANTVIDMMKSLGHDMGTTFIVATHDGRMATRCDRVMNLVDGALTQEAMKWAS
ncbi:ABC transporter ATP-binding protein [Vibrio sp. V39_P1S14PM300]|uniref:ABC transporter ATP-binding protein n=1 Tax=Vibrio sp. V39_P1S14PM300 TaxID=1938690 RepID=UPI00137240DD|nr:ABC transporter ATP-binding protein [Vibrio sp. V39_P1S14PM300]NAX23474.1 ATP-binding cassette domain-containing protein [Vibrio sp. V39_P1S14PM300]